MSPNGNNQQGGLAQALALFGLLIAISLAVFLFSPSSNPAVSPSATDQMTDAPAVIMGEATSETQGDHQHGEEGKSGDMQGDHQHGEEGKPDDMQGDHQHGEEGKPDDMQGDHQHGEEGKPDDMQGDHQHGETFVRFANLEDGQSVTSPFVVEMTVSDNLEVVPAGGDLHDHSGHLHILVNTDFTPEGEIITDDHQHLHFSEGEISAELTLEPGEYVLRLQFANSDHVAYSGEAYTDQVTITVSN